MLFDITKPEGEDNTRELSTEHPEIAKRLRAKIDTWLATLTPPGLPSRFVREAGYIGSGILLDKKE